MAKKWINDGKALHKAEVKTDWKEVFKSKEEPEKDYDIAEILDQYKAPEE